MKHFIQLISASLISVFILQPAVAQDAERKALARAQFMLKQVNSEKSQLTQQLQALQKEYDEYRKKSESQLSKVTNRQSKTNSTLGKWKESHGNLKSILQDKVIQLAQQKNINSELVDIVDKQSDNFGVCQRNNEELTRVNNELLDHYIDNNVDFSVTGFTKVKAQNFVQKYRHKIEDLSLRENSFLLKPVENVSSLVDPKPE